MPDLPIPRDLRLAVVDGVQVVLTGAAVDDDGLELRWDGVPSELTRRLDAERDVAYDGWARGCWHTARTRPALRRGGRATGSTGSAPG